MSVVYCFKQKTAYEMRISDWSSDVCSSDLPDRESDERQRQAKTALMQRVNQAYAANDLLALLELQLEIEQIDPSHIANAGEARLKHYNKEIGRESCRERVCQYVWIQVVALQVKQKKKNN